ncbi:MAG: cation:proton antiporter [Candidatus Gottesmanbacteria bacterium]
MISETLPLFTTLFLILFAALAGGIIAKALRLPLILGYIAVGVLVGNVFSSAVDMVLIERVAETGVTLLLFTLGVEFSFHRLRKVLGTVSWAATLQMLLSFCIFLPIFLTLGFSFLPAMFIAVAAALSSTAVVIRLLSERGEMETIPGEVLTGWLIVQDLAVIPIMMMIPTIGAIYIAGSASVVTTVSLLGVNLIKASIAIGAIIFLGRTGIPWVLNKIAAIGSREIFLVTVMGLVFMSGTVAYMAGLSAALGAFIAGILVAETSQNHAIFAEVRPLRDLFAVVFFVSLGMALPVSLLMPVLPNIALMTIIIVVVKAVIVYFLSRFLGYHRKTAFIVAIGLTQMSEFGFIIARVGLTQGVLSEQHYATIVALVFVTIMVSSPLFTKAQNIFYFLRKKVPFLYPNFIPEKQETELFGKEAAFKDHVVICGYGRVGRYVGRALTMAGIPFIVVDYDHTTVKLLREKNIQVIYGDPADMDVLDYAQVDYAKAVVIAIPDRHTQEMVIANAQTLNKSIRIICRTHHEQDQLRLKTLGVHTIVQPEFEAALAIAHKLFSQFGVEQADIDGKIARLKIEHGLG